MKRLKIHGIYRIKNITTDQCYYGSSIDIDLRFRVHKSQLRSNKHHNIHLQNAWNKYGEENFEFIIIEECESNKEILLEREQFYIDSLRPYYNLLPTAGSRLGSKASEETKAKQSKSMMGKNVGKTHTLEMRESMKITHKHTEQSKKKLSDAHTGKILKEETKKKMSEAHLGYVPKAESIVKTVENRSKNRLAKIKTLSQNIEVSNKFCTEGNLKKRSLNNQNVLEIRSSNLMDKELAYQFRVSPTTIRRIRLFKIYKNLV